MALGTTNISTSLVAQTIGEYVYDTNGNIRGYSTDVGTLCKSAKVNMWSRYKPIAHSKKAGLIDTDFGADSNAGNGQWGILIEQIGSTVGTNYNSANWVYDKPTGAPFKPYRIGDFRKYYHGAKKALLHNYGSGEKVFARFVLNNPSNIFFDIPRETAEVGYAITIENIYPSGASSGLYGNYYLACDVYARGATSGSPLSTYYSALPIGYSTGTYSEGARVIVIPDQLSRTAGNYEFHLYVSNYNGNVPVGGVRVNYPIYWETANPNIIPMRVVSLASQFDVLYEGIKPTSGWVSGIADEYRYGSFTNTDFGTIRTYNVKYTITNKLGVDAYIPKANMRVVYNRINTWGNAAISDYSVIGSGDLLVPASGSVTVVSQSLPIFPSNVPQTGNSFSVGVMPKLNYHNGTSYEQFTHTTSSVNESPILTYNT